LQYIEIDCSSTLATELINAYKKILDVYFNCDNINVDEIVLNSTTSFCAKAGDMWNSGCHSADVIAQHLRLHPRTIRTYLKTLSNIGYLSVNYPIKK
jgi:hypothetical protein